jgi:hypothetical protein
MREPVNVDRTRMEVPNLASYYLSERGPLGRLRRISGSMLFWRAYSEKQGLNCGRKRPRFFVVDKTGTVVSTIDDKVKTIPWRQPQSL